MKKLKNIYNRTKSGFKTVVITYVALGSLVGFGDLLIGNTTGHVSSDIYLGKHQPTKIERIICEKLFRTNLERKTK